MSDSFKPPAEIAFSPNQNSITIPCKPEHFKDFISGLLGRPQTVSRSIVDRFEIEKNDIFDVHHLLRQRIERQNGGSLVSFSIDVIYTDASSVSLNSIEDFMTYNEVKPLVSGSAIANWIWLVKFSDREIPEKQEISISFHGGQKGSTSEKIIIDDSIAYKTTDGGIDYRISHTDRSWGSDIDSLIHGYIQTKTFEKSAIAKFSSKHSSIIIGIIGSIISIASAIIVALSQNYFVDDNIDKIRQGWKSQETITGLSQRVDYIVNIISTEINVATLISISIYLLTIFLSFAFSSILVNDLKDNKPSYIFFTQKTREQKKSDLEKEKNSTLKLTAAWIATLLVAIISKLIVTIIMSNLVRT